MSSAAVGVGREVHIVGFQVGRETYGVPITSLHEIVRVPEITAVPDAPDYVEGVINLRGKIVSVIDLRKRLGEKKVNTGKRNRIPATRTNPAAADCNPSPWTRSARGRKRREALLSDARSSSRSGLFGECRPA